MKIYIVPDEVLGGTCVVVGRAVFSYALVVASIVIGAVGVVDAVIVWVIVEVEVVVDCVDVVLLTATVYF